MIEWCRLWHDMPNDPKWRTIARVSGQRIGDVIAVFIHVMVDASANATERGRMQANRCEDIATALDMEDRQVEEILSAMQGRVIDGDRLSGWEKRQPKREDGSASRAREWREKQRLERNRTQPNAIERPDTDTDTDAEKIQRREKSKNSSCSEPSEREAKAVIFIPTNRNGVDYPITENLIQEYTSLYPSVDILQQLKNMRAWSLSNPSRCKTSKGMLRFVNSWLSKEQDKGISGSKSNGSGVKATIHDPYFGKAGNAAISAIMQSKSYQERNKADDTKP